MLTKTDILAIDDLPCELVPVPEWGEGAEVCVRTMTSEEKDAFEFAAVGDAEDPEDMHMINFRARFCVKVICDADGNRLFEDEDAEALGVKSGAAISRIFSAGQKLSGITEADVKEMTKNSDASPA